MAVTEPMMIGCGPHGERIAAIVCQHLLQGKPAPSGIVENSSDPNDLQAWCYLCEDKFQREGDMTDAFREFNGMVVICVVCYAEAKVRHTITADQ